MHRSVTELANWVDRRAVDQHGEPVGVVVDIYLDMGTRRAKWLAISSGFFGTRTVVAPVRGASLLGGDVVISHPRALIGATPPVEAVVTIPPAVEQSVIDHYARRCVTPAGPLQRGNANHDIHLRRRVEPGHAIEDNRRRP